MQGDLFPTSVHLRSIDPAQNRQRFYSLHVQPDLFGGWTLVREWGRIGTAGRTRIDTHSSILNADDALRDIVRQKQRRGYQAAV